MSDQHDTRYEIERAGHERVADRYDSSAGRSWSELRDERRRALSSLATAAAPPLPPEQAAPRSGTTAPRRRRWRLVAALLMAVAVIAGVVLHTLATPSHPSTKRAPSVVSFVPRANSLDCPMDAQWSPDGKYVALLGYVRHCSLTHAQEGGQRMLPQIGPFSDPPSGLVQIYDATTGALVHQFKLDALVSGTVKLPPQMVTYYQDHSLGPAYDTPTLGFAYTHIVWLRGDSRLAVPFVTYVPTAPAPPFTQGESGPPAQPGHFVSGLLLTDTGGLNATVLTREVDPPGGGWDGLTLPMFATEWDLTTQSVVPPSAEMQSTTPESSLAPALRYTWGDASNPLDAGHLHGDTPLSPAVTPTPTGSLVTGAPAGGAGFTLWQPGMLSYETLGSVTAPDLPGAYLWETSFAALSPDGRYLLDSVSCLCQLQPGGVAAGQSEQRIYHLAIVPILPVHDAALGGVLRDLTAAPPDQQVVHLAWSADGTRLALQHEVTDAGAQPPRHVVTIYDTRTGKVLATLQPHSEAGIASDSNADLNVLRWSPDGSRLFLFDMQLGEVTIWGPGALPA